MKVVFRTQGLRGVTLLILVIVLLSGCALETREEAERRLGNNHSENSNAGNLTSVQFYVPVEEENKVSILDIVSGTIAGEIEVGEGPTTTVFASTMRQAYVANQRSSTISIVDTMNLKEDKQIEVGAMPHGMVLTPNNQKLYVATVAEPSIYVIDTKEGEVSDIIDLGTEANPNYLVLSGQQLYISDYENNEIIVINTATDEVERSFPTGNTPRAIRVSEDGSRLFVPAAGDGKLEIYNPADGTLIGEVDGVEGATDIVLTEDGSTAVVTGMEGNAVYFVDLNAMAVSSVIDDMPGAKHLSFNRQQTRVYVTLSGSEHVSVIDMETREEEERIEVGEMPHGIQIKALPGIGGSC